MFEIFLLEIHVAGVDGGVCAVGEFEDEAAVVVEGYHLALEAVCGGLDGGGVLQHPLEALLPVAPDVSKVGLDGFLEAFYEEAHIKFFDVF